MSSAWTNPPPPEPAAAPAPKPAFRIIEEGPGFLLVEMDGEMVPPVLDPHQALMIKIVDFLGTIPDLRTIQIIAAMADLLGTTVAMNAGSEAGAKQTMKLALDVAVEECKKALAERKAKGELQ
jgi:hypothetical protein